MKNNEFLEALKNRIENSKYIDKKIDIEELIKRIKQDKNILTGLQYMEETEGEPNLVSYDKENDKFIIMDTSKESPNRRSFCYDEDALNSRKKNKPENSAMAICEQYGLTLLDEKDYRFLQSLEDFDLKTSSWLLTPKNIRDLGGAIFGDKRYNTTFIYHNGADSYYGARGFRVKVEI